MILQMLRTSDQLNLELKRRTIRKRFAIIMGTKKTQVFNSFLAVRRPTSSTSKIIFSIVNLFGKTSRNNNIYFEINEE